MYCHEYTISVFTCICKHVIPKWRQYEHDFVKTFCQVKCQLLMNAALSVHLSDDGLVVWQFALTDNVICFSQLSLFMSRYYLTACKLNSVYLQMHKNLHLDFVISQTRISFESVSYSQTGWVFTIYTICSSSSSCW